MNRHSTIDGIQYLRGIAAMMVVFHHVRHVFGDVSEWTTVGSRGVDIFFVISGFVMVHTTEVSDGTWSERFAAMRRFLLKRLVRVAPLYWIALPLSAVMVYRIDLSAPGLVKDFLFFPRFSPQVSTEIWPVLTPGWTINYEMFFYLIFGLALLFGRKQFLLLSMAMIGLELLGSVVPSDSAPLRFYTSSIMLEFVFGMWLYRIWRHLDAKEAGSRSWIWWLCMAVGFAMLFMLLPGPAFLSNGIAAALIVLGAAFAFQKIWLPTLRLLGDASYSIYLFHLFSFLLGWRVVTRLGLSFSDPADTFPVVVIYLAVAAVTGIAAHYLIEKPLIHAGTALIHRFEKLLLVRNIPVQPSV